MNLTEAAIVATIVLAISGSALWMGGKVMDQVESQTTFVQTISDPTIDASAIERIARQEEAKRNEAIEQYTSRN